MARPLSVPAVVSTGGDTESVRVTQPASDKPAQVVYEVTGTGEPTSIVYGKDGFIDEALPPLTRAKLPWKRVEAYDDGEASLVLTAQNGNNNGEITCRITVEGEVIKEDTSSGPSAVVSCADSNG